MSFTIKEWERSELEAWNNAIPWHLAELLEGLSGPPSPTIMKVLRPLFNDEVLMDIFRNVAHPHALQPDFYWFWADVDDGRRTSFTDEQARQIVSHLRQVVTLDDRYLWVPEASAVTSAFAPPTTPPVFPTGGRLAASSPAPAVKPEAPATPAPVFDRTRDSRFSKMYDCNRCKKNILGLDHLYAHHITAHEGKWAWPKLKDLIGPDNAKALVAVIEKGLLVSGTSVPEEKAPLAPYPAPAPKPERPLFETGVNVDLRGWPDGRYAFVPPGLEPTTANATFIIKRTVKNPYTRRGRFLWGATTRRWETIPKGRIELRKQVGDTKELIGEQKPDESFYRGEYGKEVEAISADIFEAMRLYGTLIGACAYCGRALTDPISRLRGIGPDCFEEKHVPRVIRARAAAKAAS